MVRLHGLGDDAPVSAGERAGDDVGDVAVLPPPPASSDSVLTH